MIKQVFCFSFVMLVDLELQFNKKNPAAYTTGFQYSEISRLHCVSPDPKALPELAMQMEEINIKSKIKNQSSLSCCPIIIR